MQFSLLPFLSLATFTIAAPSQAHKRTTSYNVQVCKDRNFGGNCFEIQGPYGTCTDVPASFNDVISSIAGDQNAACHAFKDEGCRGASFVIAANGENARIPVDMNDAISSIFCGI